MLEWLNISFICISVTFQSITSSKNPCGKKGTVLFPIAHKGKVKKTQPNRTLKIELWKWEWRVRKCSGICRRLDRRTETSSRTEDWKTPTARSSSTDTSDSTLCPISSSINRSLRWPFVVPHRIFLGIFEIWKKLCLPASILFFHRDLPSTFFASEKRALESRRWWIHCKCRRVRI